MYGSYDLPVNINSEGIAIEVLREGKRVFYHRDSLGGEQEKILLVSEGNVLLNPCEPLNLPDAITPYLLVKMDKTLSVAPNSNNTIFLTFPVEIAVYLVSKKSVHLLDVFSRAAQKFTLYGEPNNGVICKRWASGVFSDIPETDPLVEGVIELRIRNETSNWLEVNKVVFNAYGMKIFYNDTRVVMKANMTLKGEAVAETEFEDSPFEKNMEKALELYKIKKISVTSAKFLMEMGI
jgi:hypothetical protein